MSVVTDNSKIVLAAMLCGAATVISLLVAFFGGTGANFEEAAALGAQTTSIFSHVGKYPIHCKDSRDATECIEGARDRKAEHSVLWLGNSQVHAINQMRHGETNAPPVLFNLLTRHGLDLITFSQPSANLQEHYVLFEYLRKQLPVRMLILPVVFDDFREEGLRDEIASLARHEPTALTLSDTEIGRRLVAAARLAPMEQETAGIAQTMQEHVELVLNRWLNANSSLWEMRPTIRAELFIALYRLRNAAFGIKATSIRRIIPGRYRDNWNALEAILTAAKSNGIGMVLYVAPIRADIEIPYDAAEYTRFKSDIERLAKQRGAIYSNLEALVPAKLWGLKDSTDLSGEAELDFMHFRADGHKILAARLSDLVFDALAGQEAGR